MNVEFIGLGIMGQRMAAFCESLKFGGLPMPCVNAAKEEFATAVWKGFGKDDYSAIIKIFDKEPNTTT